MSTKKAVIVNTLGSGVQRLYALDAWENDTDAEKADRIRRVSRWLADEADRIDQPGSPGSASRPSSQSSSSSRPLVDRHDLISRATFLYTARRHRDRIFGTGMFGEPAWDIMLDLLINQLKGKLVSVSSACIAASTPATTSLRYISRLEEADLVARSADPNDGRKYYLSLTNRGLLLMLRFFCDGTISKLSPLRWPDMIET